ncbi:DegT/DnrJ/EryC1/StrS family aminotransferase [Bilifractor sp. LCP21S3_A7]|uniref:DegT/DnrJ/EryC1/StrS family aminotransferase n=1 Tax=Bilifractor sp. LCP21S3_A7 TaxID=3438738 RepID=UPI003F8FCEA9
MKRNNIFGRKYFYPLTADQACFKNKYKFMHLEVARRIAGEVLVLPFSAEMSVEQAENIASVIRKDGGYNKV